MLNIDDLTRTRWDVLVIGTGVGGATAGYALARAGKRVLFLEKGRSPSIHPDTLRGTYPEMFFPDEPIASTANAGLLARGGRCSDEIDDGQRRFIPLIGCGGGGSSALYGMAMERFFPADFAPREHFPQGSAALLPERWPVDYDEMAPYYRHAEQL